MPNPNPANSAIQPTFEQTFRHAVAVHEAGQLHDAGTLYHAFLQAHPNHPEANHNMGALAVQLQQAAAGLAFFTAALDADPACARYWLSYIDALSQAGQLDEARQILALARQQGLQGDEVDALATRLDQVAPVVAEHQPPAGDFRPAPATSSNSNFSATIPAPSPDQQEVQALLALLNAGRLPAFR